MFIYIYIIVGVAVVWTVQIVIYFQFDHVLDWKPVLMWSWINSKPLIQISHLSLVLCFLARPNSMVDLVPRLLGKLGCLVGIQHWTTGQTQISQFTGCSKAYVRSLTWIPSLSLVLCPQARANFSADPVPRPPEKLGCSARISQRTLSMRAWSPRDNLVPMTTN